MGDPRFYPRLTFSAPPEEYTEYETSRVVVLPVPYDSTTTARSGAKDGPRMIILSSEDMELYDFDLGCEPFMAGIHTLAELSPDSRGPKEMTEKIEAVVGELVEGGKIVATLGGEHTVAIGAALAHAKRFAGMSVLAIDAHADMREEYLNSPYSHACSIRRISEVAPVVQVGLRSVSADDLEAVRSGAFYTPKQYRAAGAEAVASRLSDTVYVTFDLDGLDPSIMAAVGTPEPGGLLWDETLELLDAVAKGRRIVGFDVCELSPAYGPRACSQLAARLTYHLIGLAANHLRRD